MGHLSLLPRAPRTLLGVDTHAWHLLRLTLASLGVGDAASEQTETLEQNPQGQRRGQGCGGDSGPRAGQRDSCVVSSLAVCVCVYVCVCTNMRVHVCCMHCCCVHVCAPVHVCTGVLCTCTCTYTCVCSCVCVCAHVCHTPFQGPRGLNTHKHTPGSVPAGGAAWPVPLRSEKPARTRPVSPDYFFSSAQNRTCLGRAEMLMRVTDT